MQKVLGLVLFLFMVLACNNDEENMVRLADGTNFRVNYFRLGCQGLVPQQCLLVQEGAALGTEDWNFFYSNIEGFDFEPGFVYNLDISKKKIPDPPQDASSIAYKLVRVISKTPVICDFEDPTQDLEWLQLQIQVRSGVDDGSIPLDYIVQAKRNNTPVFVFQPCEPTDNALGTVLDCLGRTLGFLGDDIAEEEITDRQLLWQPQNNACQPSL